MDGIRFLYHPQPGKVLKGVYAGALP